MSRQRGACLRGSLRLVGRLTVAALTAVALTLTGCTTVFQNFSDLTGIPVYIYYSGYAFANNDAHPEHRIRGMDLYRLCSGLEGGWRAAGVGAESPYDYRPRLSC